MNCANYFPIVKEIADWLADNVTTELVDPTWGVVENTILAIYDYDYSKVVA